MKSKLLFLMAFLSTFALMAQKVESKPYGMLLGSLLSHSVNEVAVKNVSSIKNPIFVDARERNEFNVSHIENAIFVGYDSLDLSQVPKSNLERPIIVYCSVGYRSEKVAEKLINLGFSNVYNLYGGIFEWVNQNKKVYRNGQITNQVHGYNRVWSVWLNKGEKIYD